MKNEIIKIVELGVPIIIVILVNMRTWYVLGKADGRKEILKKISEINKRLSPNNELRKAFDLVTEACEKEVK